MVLLTRSGSSTLVASATNTIAPCPSYRRPFTPNPSLKGIFAGSGVAAMSNPIMAQAVVDLTQRSDPQDVSLLYIGTASYDIAKYREKQTNTFAKLGVKVDSLNVANTVVPREMMVEKIGNSDIILVSGGNTLYAVDRWVYLGLDELLKDAAYQGKVMAGGSAGAICWFDGGHSDSMDPETYRLFKLNNQNEKSNGNGKNGEKFSSFRYCGDGSESIQEDNKSNDWEYIRVEGLGLWPGLVCPHYDRIQSNGIPRMTDFDSMMKRHPYELGIGIDHHAALEVNGDDFRILSIPGETGSVPMQDDNGEESNVPGAWLKFVDENGKVQSTASPTSGKITELLQILDNPEKHLLLDADKVAEARKENPLLKD